MARIGVRFHRLSPSAQTALERYLFDRMREEARQKRHVRGLWTSSPHPERRMAHRLSLDLEVLVGRDRPLSLEGQLRAIAERSRQQLSPAPVTLCNLSATGCGLLVSSGVGFHIGQAITISLRGEGLDLHLDGEVVYVLE